MDKLANFPSSTPGLFDTSISVKVVEVARKYDEPDVRPRRSFVSVCCMLTLTCPTLGQTSHGESRIYQPRRSKFVYLLGEYVCILALHGSLVTACPSPLPFLLVEPATLFPA